MPPPADPPLLGVSDLVTTFATEGGIVRAVDGVSFNVREGSTLALVGESGCGKSATALSILRLIPDPPGRIERGEVRFRGKDILAMPERELCALRGGKVSIVFQEPMTSLNPVYPVGAQIAEAIRLHRDVSRREAWTMSVELLRRVGIASAAERSRDYPHQLSGGMRQRALLAMAIACGPELLLADEPTTALDVTLQAQVLDLFRRLRDELKMSLLLITHDLGVVAELADEIAVLYAGALVEMGPAEAVLTEPLHPYTRALVRIARAAEGGGARTGRPGERAALRLPTLEGMVPDLRALPPGCRFRDRCPEAIPACGDAVPPLETLGEGRSVRCLVAARAVRGAA